MNKIETADIASRSLLGNYTDTVTLEVAPNLINGNLSPIDQLEIHKLLGIIMLQLASIYGIITDFLTPTPN